jgi:hypothetical protein
MRTINIYSNGSPIHSRVIEFLLERSTADENVVINFRGMRMVAEKPVTQFHCDNEEYLNERAYVKHVFDFLNLDIAGGDRVNLYVSHSNYLLCKIHFALGLGSYSYIEDGIGTYSALIDDAKGTGYFAAAIGTDVSRSAKRSLIGCVSSLLPGFIRGFSLALAKRTWNIARTLSINLFTLALRNNEVFFDFSHQAYCNIYLTISKFPHVKSVAVPLLVSPAAVNADALFLVLIPPPKIIGMEFFSRFVTELTNLKRKVPARVFEYKSHPSDTENVGYHNIIDNDELSGKLITVNANNETAVVAYELGYKGLICFDSSATMYAMSFLPKDEFECIDLCKEMTGREGFAVRIANELATL